MRFQGGLSRLKEGALGNRDRQGVQALTWWDLGASVWKQANLGCTAGAGWRGPPAQETEEEMVPSKDAWDL